MRTDVAALWDEWAEEDEFGDPLGPTLDSGQGPVDFAPGVRLRIRVRIALGADLTADPASWAWTDITEYVRYEPGIRVTSGRFDESSRVTPGSASLSLDNRDGRFSRYNPTGPYYGQLTRNTPIWITANPGNVEYDVARMFVNEWPGRYDKKRVDFVVPIQCGGILRRLSQGESPLRSALFRTISTDPDLAAYWPCEDGNTAEQYASALPGSAAMTAVDDNITPSASNLTSVATAPLPVISTGTGTYLRGSTAATSSTAWTVSGLFYFTAAPITDSVLLQVHAAGQVTRWWLTRNATTGDLTLRGSDSDGTTLFTSTAVNATNFLNRPVMLWFAAEEFGPDISYSYGFSTPAGYSASNPLLLNKTLGRVQTVIGTNGGSAEDVALGHFYVLNTFAGLVAPAARDALDGYGGPASTEQAVARIKRICTEEGVALTIPSGQEYHSAFMGLQPIASFLSVLREAEEVDGGVLYEDGWGLGYQPLAARYNADVAMTITHADLGYEPEPTDDDQALRNEWTVTRSNGTTETVRDEASQALEGAYRDSATLNLSKDQQAAQAAAWRVHLGTVPEQRWPALGINLANARGRAVIPQWTGLGYGARMLVTSPPTEVLADPIDVFIEGTTQTLDQFEWSAIMNTSPARPYVNALVLDHPVYGLMDTDGSTITVAINTTDTSLTVETTNAGSVPWGIDPGNTFDINVGGERMTVTAIAGATSPQTFTVARSVNGVVKAHDAGSDVSLWRPNFFTYGRGL